VRGVFNESVYVPAVRDLTRDNITEHPSTINVLSRMNIYQEVFLAAVYRLLPALHVNFIISLFTWQWRRYTRACQDKWPGWKIHHPGSRPGSALPSLAYCFALVIVWTENKNVTISDRFILTVKRRWRHVFWGRQLKKEKVHPGDLAGGFSDLEMTWLLYCAGAGAGTWTFLVLLGFYWFILFH